MKILVGLKLMNLFAFVFMFRITAGMKNVKNIYDIFRFEIFIHYNKGK